MFWSPAFRRHGPSGTRFEREGGGLYLLSKGAQWVLTETLDAAASFGRNADLAEHPAEITTAWDGGIVRASTRRKRVVAVSSLDTTRPQKIRRPNSKQHEDWRGRR